MPKTNEKGSTLLISLFALAWIVFVTGVLMQYAIGAQQSALTRGYTHNTYTMAEQGAVFYCDEMNQVLKLQQSRIDAEMSDYTEGKMGSIPEDGILLIRKAKAYLMVADLFFEKSLIESYFGNSGMSMDYTYQVESPMRSEPMRIRQRIEVNDVDDSREGAVEGLTDYDKVKKNMKKLEEGLKNGGSWESLINRREILETELNHKNHYGIETISRRTMELIDDGNSYFQDYEKQVLWTELAYDVASNQMVIQSIQAERMP